MTEHNDQDTESLEDAARKVPDDLGKLERGPAGFRERMRKVAQRKQQVTIRLDADVISSFKQLAGPDGSYQSLINRALVEWLEAKSVRGLLEEAIADIVRERS